jgi:hypothetical protein
MATERRKVHPNACGGVRQPSRLLYAGREHRNRRRGSPQVERGYSNPGSRDAWR